MHNWIMKMGDTMVVELKQMFSVIYYCFSHADCLSLTCSSQQHTGKVSISLDAWTSKNQIAFLAIMVHYVMNNWRLGKPVFLSHLYYSLASTPVITWLMPSGALSSCMVSRTKYTFYNLKLQHQSNRFQRSLHL